MACSPLPLSRAEDLILQSSRGKVTLPNSQLHFLMLHSLVGDSSKLLHGTVKAGRKDMRWRQFYLLDAHELKAVIIK